MSWTPLAERFATLPLLLAGPILRRVEPDAVTVWLALKEARTVTLVIYGKKADGELRQQFVGMRRTVRLGDHLHVVAVTARAEPGDQSLLWGEYYCYDLFFQAEQVPEKDVPATTAHLSTSGVLVRDPASTDDLHRCVYPGQSLPGFVLPPEDVDSLRIMHGSCR